MNKIHLKEKIDKNLLNDDQRSKIKRDQKRQLNKVKSAGFVNNFSNKLNNINSNSKLINKSIKPDIHLNNNFLLTTETFFQDGSTLPVTNIHSNN